MKIMQAVSNKINKISYIYANLMIYTSLQGRIARDAETVVAQNITNKHINHKKFEAS